MLSSTTPAEPSDRTLTPKGLIKEGFITQKLFDEVKETATRLLMHGQETAANRGLILVDTKHEFGPDERGDLVLIDEIHTPDSSRYWQLASYAEHESGAGAGIFRQGIFALVVQRAFRSVQR